MTNYKDVESFVEWLKSEISFFGEPKINSRPIAFGSCNALKTVLEAINNLPTADVVEVCRCKDCKYYNTQLMICYNNDFPFHCESRPIMRETDYCSYGERRA